METTRYLQVFMQLFVPIDCTSATDAQQTGCIRRHLVLRSNDTVYQIEPSIFDSTSVLALQKENTRDLCHRGHSSGVLYHIPGIENSDLLAYLGLLEIAD